MPVDREIQALVELIAGGIRASALTSEKAKSVGTDYADKVQAAVSSAELLAALFLSDVKRIADAMEIIAKDTLDKQALSEASKSMFNQS